MGRHRHSGTEGREDCWGRGGIIPTSLNRKGSGTTWRLARFAFCCKWLCRCTGKLQEWLQKVRTLPDFVAWIAWEHCHWKPADFSLCLNVVTGSSVLRCNHYSYWPKWISFRNRCSSLHTHAWASHNIAKPLYNGSVSCREQSGDRRGWWWCFLISPVWVCNICKHSLQKASSIWKAEITLHYCCSQFSRQGGNVISTSRPSTLLAELFKKYKRAIKLQPILPLWPNICCNMLNVEL